MKRTRIKRKTPFKRAGWIKRLLGVKKYNHKRLKKLRDQQFGDHAVWIRTLGCLVCGDWPTEPHHWPTRGNGGKAKDMTPLCKFHHDIFHLKGPETFARTWGIDLKAEAARLWAENGGTDE